MGKLGNKMGEMNRELAADLEDVNRRVVRADRELVRDLDDIATHVSQAEDEAKAKVADVKARARATRERVEKDLDAAAAEAEAELLEEERQLDSFMNEVNMHLEADIRSVEVDVLRDLDSLLGKALARVRTELSKRSNSQPSPQR